MKSLSPAIRFAAAVCLGALGACVSSPAQRASDSVESMRRTAAVMQRREEADAWMVSAVLLRLSDQLEHREPIAALAAARHAVALAPQRAELVWLQAQLCTASEGCDPAPMESRLRELDPSNGVAWLGALQRAALAHDETGVDAALAVIGQSAHVNVYWNVLDATLSTALVEAQQMRLGEALTTVSGLLSGLSPSYQHVANACKGDALQRAQRIELCRAAGQSLMRGDTVLTEMIGVGIAKRSWPEPSPEWAAAAQARRTYDYRLAMGSHHDVYLPRTAAQYQQYLQLLRSHTREQDVMVAQLRAAKIEPLPPVDWKVPAVR